MIDRQIRLRNWRPAQHFGHDLVSADTFDFRANRPDEPVVHHVGSDVFHLSLIHI